MRVPNLTVSISPVDGSKISYQSGYNTITLTYRSDISLTYEEVRITKDEEYDIGVGKLAQFTSGSISANQDHVITIPVNSTNFTKGDGTYTISLYVKNAVDGSWNEYHLFITLEGYDFLPKSADGLEVVTDQEIPVQ